MKQLKGVCLGAGYFSHFQYEAWQRIPEVAIVAFSNRDAGRARTIQEKFAIAKRYADYREMFDTERPDFVDVITPPPSHREICAEAAARGIDVICQKPLAPTLGEAEAIVADAERAGMRLMVHENFRFQPWHREIKRQLEHGAVGARLQSLYFRCRMGDGWGRDAYLARQPYFRDYPRLLVYETGVHFIDTFRYLAGEIERISAWLRRLNPVIRGEDCGLLVLEFAGGAMGVWDANRYNESNCEDPRYTFGELLVEGDGGALRLYADGRLTLQELGGRERDIDYRHEHRGFAGDCCYATQRHFVDCLLEGRPFETDGREYLKTLAVQEAVYLSAAERRPVRVAEVAAAASTVSTRRIIDLTLPIDAALHGAAIEPATTIARGGWNASTLTLYSHCGTHMDAPRHFLEGAAGVDQIPLAACCGPAKLLNLTPTAPRELITLARLKPWADEIRSGDRLLLRTDWHRRIGTDAYRNQLPRISADLARWLVEKRIALLGVEPPSVADVNHIAELSEVHRILLQGNVVVVEGLAHLDQVHATQFQLIVLPLRIVSGDGSPVRAIAIEAVPAMVSMASVGTLPTTDQPG
jgi:predicted dehydrogenase/kynurenine formamidase